MNNQFAKSELQKLIREKEIERKQAEFRRCNNTDLSLEEAYKEAIEEVHEIWRLQSILKSLEDDGDTPSIKITSEVKIK